MKSFLAAVATVLASLSLALIPANAAAQEPPPLDAYGELPDIEDVAISPSGSFLALAGTFKGARRVMILDSDRKLRRVMHLDGDKLRGIRFVGDDHLLIYRSQTMDVTGFVADKYELTQALVIPVDERAEPEVVFSRGSKLHNAVYGSYGARRTADGWRAYFGAIEFVRRNNRGYEFQHGRPALYQVDLRDMKARRIDTSAPEGRAKDWLLLKDGTLGATFMISRSSGNWTIDNAGGETIARGTNPSGDVGLVGFGKDSSTLIFYQGDDDTGSRDWFEVPLTGGEPIPFLADVDIERLYWNRQTDEILGYLEDGEELRPVFFDPEREAVAKAVRQAFSGMNSQMMEWTPDMDKVIVRTNGLKDSGTWFLVDMETYRADAIGYDRLAIAPDFVGPFSTVEYTAQDGLEMDGILTLPPGREAKNLPIVMLPHGGPHAQDREQFDWWAQAFASRGYAVFQPNFRGSTGRGDAFERASSGEWGRKMQTDISDGLAALAEKGIVDPKRACIVGASYGGYAALAGVTLQQGLYRCAVSVAGVSDLRLMYRTDVREAGKSKLLKRSLQEELGPSDQWKAVSPREQAASADAPILLIHGEDDTVVPYEQSAVMADALKDNDKPYKLVKLDGEDHWLSLAETRKAMLRETVAFVEQHNPPD